MKEAPCAAPKREWVVGLAVKRGSVIEPRMYNVYGDNEAEAISAALSYEPGSAVQFVRADAAD